ncbi:hypothetical protein [Streptomyces sp. gb1(2016)]|uniref:MmyB family transcriptional regulator n=1 Tax=Streptomyces sp. gb1(2016) TaxID=1828321 RepID=UPI0021CAB3B9|nr:hypothetical protein [Streptomyces sp. gb1(2016)]
MTVVASRKSAPGVGAGERSARGSAGPASQVVRRGPAPGSRQAGYGFASRAVRRAPAHRASCSSPAAGAPPTPAPPREVRPPVLETLRLLEPGIAVVTNRLGDVLARTSAYESVTAGTGLLDTDAPNLTRYVFTDPRARTFFADWDAVADEQAFDLWLAPSVENSEWLTAELAPVAGPAADEETSQALARLRDLPPHGRLRAIS